MFATMLLVAALAEPAAAPAPSEGPAADPTSDDLLGEIEVEADDDPWQELPPFRVHLSIFGDGPLTDRVRASVRADMLAFGRFVLVDDEAGSSRGLDGTIRIDVAALDPGEAVVSAQATIGARELEIGARVIAGAGGARQQAHRLVDELVEAFTGHPGPFAAPLAIVRIQPRRRQAWTFDLDGGRAHARSAPDEVVSMVAFDPHGRPTWARSVDGKPFGLTGPGKPLEPLPPGAVYGLAWAADGRLAVALAGDDGIGMWTVRGRGAAPHSKLPIAMQPVFSRDGRLGFVEGNEKRRRIRFDGRVVSPKGVDASSPTVCEHTSGTRLLWIEHFGRRNRLVVARPDGTERRVLDTRDAKIASPACAPDGRLVAYVVTEGGRTPPGLYVANLDRWRPRRVNDMVGDGLRWSSLRR